LTVLLAQRQPQAVHDVRFVCTTNAVAQAAKSLDEAESLLGRNRPGFGRPSLVLLPTFRFSVGRSYQLSYLAVVRMKGG
jgi:hypothetical protein